MENEIYWIWLQQCWGYGKKIDRFRSEFVNAKRLYDADDKEIKAVFSSKYSSQLIKRDLKKAKEIFEFCKEHKIHIVTPDSDFYPSKLLEIEDFPLVLYVRGELEALEAQLSIAVIGSRTCSAYGEEVAKDVVSDLAKNNVVIVSGGAVGIDSVAHRTTIENGGKTVLVMGCGHGYGYLPENSGLRKSVAENGALVTEYPPLFPVDQGSFPRRNRIISALSDGVVIIEAAERSGTLNTKNHALKQGRKIFVLPGDTKSGRFDGSNHLISEGAIPIFSGEEILNHYGIVVKEKKNTARKTGTPFENIDEKGLSARKGRVGRKKKVAASETKKASEPIETLKEEEKVIEKAKNPPEGISKNAEIVYNVMSEGVIELDEIIRKSALGVGTVLACLSELEIFGAISKTSPQTFEIN